MRNGQAVVLVALTSWLALGMEPARAQAANKDVVVTNTSSQPVPVIGTVNQPVQVTKFSALTGPTNVVLYVVPTGKRLVVEHFTSEVGVVPTSTVNRYAVGIAEDPSIPGLHRFTHYIPPAYSAPCGTCSPGQVEIVASEAVRMYVEAGEALVVNVAFSAAVGPNAFGFFSITGHLTDAP